MIDLSSFGHRNPSQMSSDDWLNLRFEVETVFTPGTAIKQQDLFSGRSEQIQKLAQRIRLAGAHAVIYGERGVGKSSLVNIFKFIANELPASIQYIRVAATTGDGFSDIFLKVFKRMKVQATDDGAPYWLADNYQGKTITPDDVLLEFENFSEAATPIIVIDEFDRLATDKDKALVSDTIKLLSDESANATFFIVGVSDAVDDLLKGHESIGRAIAEVEMPRMSDSEISDVITDRVKNLGFKIHDDALWKCIFICKGLPHYAHLIGLHALQAACDRKSINVEEEDIETATQRALSETNQSIKDSFESATYSERKDNIFKEVLVACALAEKDPLGKFDAKSIASRLTIITGKDYDAPAFSYHLSQFCEENRGGLLEKSGVTRNFKYRFKEALMEPYVILQSLQKGIIRESHINAFGPRRQKDLFSPP